MNRSTAFYSKIFLNRFHKGDPTPLFEYLSEGGEDIRAIDSSKNEILSAFKSPSKILQTTHYSWLLETLSPLPKEQQILYLASLPVETTHKLKSLLKINEEIVPLKGSFRIFVQKELVKSLLPEEFIPLNYIPSSSLEPLSHLTKEKLIHLIDYLGLFDLAEEMKKIVDTKLLRKISESLLPAQKAFLKQCLKKKDRIQSPPFPLGDWGGDPKDLQMRLHKKGLVRLAKALSGQNYSFIWHVTHTLDTGRGKRLEAMVGDKEVPQITESMIAKVLQLIPQLEKE